MFLPARHLLPALVLCAPLVAVGLEKDAEVGRTRDGSPLFGRDLVPDADLSGAIFKEDAVISAYPVDRF